MEFLREVMEDLAYVKDMDSDHYKELTDWILQRVKIYRSLIKRRRQGLHVLKKNEEGGEKQQRLGIENIMKEIGFIKSIDPENYKQIRYQIFGAAKWVRIDQRRPCLSIVRNGNANKSPEMLQDR